jgi:hypothetical protein
MKLIKYKNDSIFFYHAWNFCELHKTLYNKNINLLIIMDILYNEFNTYKSFSIRP